MTKNEWNHLYEILEAKRAELGRLARNREGIVIERAADAIDEVQHATERELAIRHLDRESDLLRNVRNALQRMEQGAFGVCLRCEEGISSRRLAAIPWAAYCIQCQELADRNPEGHKEDHLDKLASMAA
jgi:DnaK suppressor protein